MSFVESAHRRNEGDLLAGLAGRAGEIRISFAVRRTIMMEALENNPIPEATVLSWAKLTESL
jgi:hypothetical protein